MARIAGVDLPKNKKIETALTYVYGVGPALSKRILESLAGEIEPTLKVKDMTEHQAMLLNKKLQDEYKVEGELRREITQNIQRYIEIGSYRGSRHRKSLPVRGQRTKTNGRTRRGRRRTVGSK